MRPCDTVANCSLPCVSYGSFKLFKMSASDFGTVGMGRSKRACADKFLATMVTEGVGHGLYKVTRLHMNLSWLKDRGRFAQHL